LSSFKKNLFLTNLSECSHSNVKVSDSNTAFRRPRRSMFSETFDKPWTDWNQVIVGKIRNAIIQNRKVPLFSPSMTPAILSRITAIFAGFYCEVHTAHIFFIISTFLTLRCHPYPLKVTKQANSHLTYIFTFSLFTST